MASTNQGVSLWNFRKRCARQFAFRETQLAYGAEGSLREQLKAKHAQLGGYLIMQIVCKKAFRQLGAKQQKIGQMN